MISRGPYCLPSDVALASYAALCAICSHVTQLPFMQSIGCNHDFFCLGFDLGRGEEVDIA